jgi:DNA-binding transcriptional regulator YdaS (Cro superfamily)
MSKKPRVTGIQKAVNSAGGIRPLANLIGVNKDVIRKSLNRGWLTPKHCYAVCEATGVPLHELNPDVFRQAA